MLKEEALRYIENLKWLKGFDNTRIGVKSVAEIFDGIAEMINDGWVSVKDRLPEEKGWYMVYAPGYSGGSSSGLDSHNAVMFAKWSGKTWSIEVGYHKRPGCVRQWMPIPIPKEGQDEETD